MKNFIIFGASGDLAKNYIYPSLANLFKTDLKFNYFGYGRTAFTEIEFQSLVKESSPNSKIYKHFTYLSGSYDYAGISQLKNILKDPDSVFYLAVPTSVELTIAIIQSLKKSRLITPDSIIALEKPFGHDYTSAKLLMSKIKKLVNFNQIFFVDHYLTKELVKNIISLRFANPIIQHLWNNKHLEKIEIYATETRGIDNRGLYYDTVGALRDMVQNHCLQLLSLVTMDQPSLITPASFASKKLKVLKHLRLFGTDYNQSVKLGQYKSYTRDLNIDPNSHTDTYAKVTFELDNSRWRGLPITIITGKKLDQKLTEIRLIFKNNLNCLWGEQCRQLPQNQLTINIYPKNEIRLTLNADFNPGKKLPTPSNLFIAYSDKTQIARTAYENVIADIASGNRLNSPSYQEILAQWRLIDNIRSNPLFEQIIKIY